MSEVLERVVRINGTSLWTATQGTGFPLVLCHGGPGAYDTLGAVADMVDDLVTVHRYDQRACGRSGRDRPWDETTFRDDLDALREHFGHERWVVAGHSFGAKLALSYAVEHPDRCAAILWLCNASRAFDRGWNEAYRRERAARMTPEERAREEELRGVDGVEARRERRRLVAPTDMGDRSQPPPDWNQEWINEELNASLDLTNVTPEALGTLPMPLLAVHGEGDPRRGVTAEILGRSAHGRHVMLPGVGHYPWLERPDELRAVLRGFLTDLS